MFFRGRGYLYLAERAEDGTIGPFNRRICTDSLSLDLATESFEHINKCGPVDVVDYRDTLSQSGTLNLTFADMDDYNFALGVLGTITGAATAGTITDEQLPDGIMTGDVYFLGGVEGHRTITALSIGALVLNTDYTLNATTGAVTFLTDIGSPAPTADYGYTDPASVSLFTAANKEYFGRYEFINRANNNKAGSLELYRIRLDPLQNLDMQSEQLQIATLSGSVLADLTRAIGDTEFGQFGRRIL